jgi:hypothetical protein
MKNMNKKIKYKIKTEKYFVLTYERLEEIIRNEYEHDFFIDKDQDIENIIEFNEDKRIIVFVSGKLTGHDMNRVNDFIQSGRYNWLLKNLMNYMCEKKLIKKGTYLIK